jgi:hypothetical protein
MIQAIINVLDQAGVVVGTSYGLCTHEVDTAGKRWAVQHVGGTSAQRVSGPSWSYWRVVQPIRQRRSDALIGSNDATDYTITLRYVVCGERELCAPDVINNVVTRMRHLEKYIQRSIQAVMVRIDAASIETDPQRAAREVADTPVPLHLAIAYADLEIQVTATEACLQLCSEMEQTIPTY